MPLLKIIGILGLLLITTGMIVKKRTTRNILCVFGGIALLLYSIYIKDLIFIILQAVYVVVVIFDFIKIKKHAQS